MSSDALRMRQTQRGLRVYILLAAGLVSLALIAYRWSFGEHATNTTIPVLTATIPSQKTAQIQSVDTRKAARTDAHTPIRRQDAYKMFDEFVCENGESGACDQRECTISKEDYNRIPWKQSPDTVRRQKKLVYNDSASVYSMAAGQWDENADETGELKKLNQMLNYPPDSSLCSNPLCRLGPPQDGGWSVCIDDHHLQNRDCVVYSVGISFEPFFSVAAAALGCEVFMLDHTLNYQTQQVMKNLHHRLHFHPLGLAPRSTSTLVSLSDFMQSNTHDFIDVLKIDCEGCEWAVFESFANSHPQLLEKVGQLLIEVHIIKGENLDDIQPVMSFVDHVFGKHGFKVAYRHLNPWGVFNGNHYSNLVTDQGSLKDQPNVLDYSFWELVLLRSK